MGGLFKKPAADSPPVPEAPARPSPPRRKGLTKVALDNVPADVQRIIDAVAADRVEELQAAAAEYDVSQLWIGPQTLLHCAAQNGGLETARWLLEQGIDPDMPTAGTEVTPLLYAVRCGHLEIARLLLASGADVNAAISERDPRYPKLSALHAAAISGKAEMVRLLLERGADPTARDGQNLTPLESGLKVGQAHLESVFSETHEVMKGQRTATPPPSLGVRDLPPGKYNYQANFKFASFFGQGEGALQLNVTGNNETDAKMRAEDLLASMMLDDDDKAKLEGALGFPIVFWALESLYRK